MHQGNRKLRALSHPFGHLIILVIHFFVDRFDACLIHLLNLSVVWNSICCCVPIAVIIC